VINGYRSLPPDERSQQYEDSLRIAAESMRYCVVEATKLFEAVKEHMEGGSGVTEFCQQLIATEGILGAPSVSPDD